jgi:hypothetical protein
LCTSVSWGVPTNTSLGPFGGKSGASINTGLDQTATRNTPIENQVVNDPNVLGEIFVLGSLTHWNRRISATGFPDGFTANINVEYNVSIEDDLGDSVDLSDVFNLVFTETLNAGPVESCPTANLAGSVCDDTFQFFGNDTLNFSLSGTDYTLGVIGFCEDEDAVKCLESDGIFYSPEDGASVGLVLELKEEGEGPAAPAPGALALISVGLIGMSYARRRSAKGSPPPRG